MFLAVLGVPAAADGKIRSGVQMVILGTKTAEGVFLTNAISISVGSGNSVATGYVADATNGALGTAVVTGTGEIGDLTENLQGYDTQVCATSTCTDMVQDQ